MATAEMSPVNSSKAQVVSRSDEASLSKVHFDGLAGQEHLREVVLSTQMREIERRAGRLEEKLSKELGHLRTELTARMEALEKHVHAESEAAALRLAQESQDRQLADKQALDEVRSAKSALVKDLDSLRQQMSKSERDLRQAGLDAAKSLSADLHRVHEELTAELNAEVYALEDGKVARNTLAAMLSELVVRLNAGQTSGGSRFEK